MENHYTNISLLYSTSEGSKVYTASSIKDRHSYILKMIKQPKSSKDTPNKQIAMNRELTHEHVVQMMDCFLQEDKGVNYQVIVLEYCSGGSLDLRLPTESIDLYGRVQWLLDAAKGLEYIHSKRIIHGDIKPQNIFLLRGKAKIGDLGIARPLRQAQIEQQQGGKRLGTYWYTSPQVLKGNYIGTESDVWSFGIVCLEVILNCRINILLQGEGCPAGRETFPAEDLLERIQEKKLRILVKKMLERSQKKRPPMSQVVQTLIQRLKSMKKHCGKQVISLELPLEKEQLYHGEEKPEWIYRIDPCKKDKKVEKYKLITSQNTVVEVRYDDYLQSLKMTYQSMEIVYQYKTLPNGLKEVFKNLKQLNQALKKSNTKISFVTSGALMFNFKSRDSYDPNNKLSKSMRSESSVTSSVASSVAASVIKILNKYDQDPIEEMLGKEDGGSSMGGKMSIGRRSGSAQEDSSGKSFQLGMRVEKQRENRENQDVKIVEEEQAENQQPNNEPKQEEPKIESTNLTSPPSSQLESHSRSETSGIQEPGDQQSQRQEPVEQIQEEQIVERPEQPRAQQPPNEQEFIIPPENAEYIQIQQQQQLPTYSVPPRASQHRTRHFPRSPNRQQEGVNPQVIKDLQQQIIILQKVQGPQRTILPDHYMNLAGLYARNKDDNKTDECLEKAIKHYRENHLYYSDMCAKAHYYRGEMYLRQAGKQEDSEENQSVEERQLTAAEERAQKPLQTAADILLKLKSYDFATFNKVYNLLGQIYLDARSFLIAQNCFQNALSRLNDITGKRENRLAFSPIINLGRLYRKWKKYAQALNYFLQALEFIQKSNFPIHELSINNQMQACCLGIKDFAQGLGYLERALVLSRSFDSQPAEIAEKLLSKLQKEIDKWTDVLLEEHSPGIKRHLEFLLRLIEQYHAGSIRKSTVESRIQQAVNY